MTKRPEMRCHTDAFGPASAVLLGRKVREEGWLGQEEIKEGQH